MKVECRSVLYVRLLLPVSDEEWLAASRRPQNRTEQNHKHWPAFSLGTYQLTIRYRTPHALALSQESTMKNSPAQTHAEARG